KSSTLDAEQLPFGIVTVLVSFDGEKREACFCVAQGEVEPLVRRQFFQGELIDGCLERRGQLCRVLRDKRHRSLLRATQEIVKHKNAEEGIGRYSETQLDNFCS